MVAGVQTKAFAWPAHSVSGVKPSMINPRGAKEKLILDIPSPSQIRPVE